VNKRLLNVAEKVFFGVVPFCFAWSNKSLYSFYRTRDGFSCTNGFVFSSLKKSEKGIKKFLQYLHAVTIDVFVICYLQS
jgi:hypothetical protein